MGKLNGLLQLIRPVNCAMMGFAVVVGASFVEKEIFSPEVSMNLLLGFITSFTLTGSSMVINDYYDRQIDAINEPSRPIPSGLVSTREALSLAFVLSITGLAAALMTSLPCLLIAIIALIISATYNTKGKYTGLLGNLLVSTCVVITFIYGGFTVDKGLALTTLLSVAIAFLSITGREITKGIVDVQGDRSQNVKTIAVLHGEKTAAAASSILQFLAVGLSPLPWLLEVVSDWFLPFVIFTDAGLVFSSVSLLRDYSRENARRIKNLNLVWLIVGLSAFIAGSFG
jgi:geranylgeranylglycerol-phosphate geranylgeranyltransferase